MVIIVYLFCAASMTMILVRRWSFNRQSRLLLDDLSDGTSPDGPAALANRKAEASANGVRVGRSTVMLQLSQGMTI